MDEREELIAEEGFDWLYGEDADGSVLEEAPAIGAVTERGATQAAVPPEEAVFDALEAEPHDDPEPFASEEPEPTPAASFMDFDEPAGADEFLQAGPEAQDEPAPSGDVDMAELDASFGPPTEVAAAGIPYSSVQQPSPVREAAAPPASPPPPPPAPVEVQTAQVPAVPTPADVQVTTEMSAIEPPTSQIPALSSRGDIIAVGARKVSFRERLRPAPRAARSKAAPTGGTQMSTPASSASKQKGSKGTKVLAATLVLALSAGAAVWKVEGLHKMIFGNGAPSEAQVDAAFTPLKGYSYSEVPGEVMSQMQEVSKNFMPEEVAHYDVRLLGQLRDPEGMVLITSVDPDLATPQRWNAEMQESSPQNLGAVRQTKFAGVRAAIAEVPQARGATMAMFPDPDGLLFFVYGRSDAVALDVAKQLAKANS